MLLRRQPLGAEPRHVGVGSVAMALLAGALHTAAFAPMDAWWLQTLALAALVGCLAGRTPRQGAVLGLAFGFAWLCTGLWWLFISMHRYGQLPVPLAGLAVALLSLGLAIYVAVACACYARWRTGRPLIDATLFAACWLVAELARATWLTGFPWLAAGYAHTSGPLAALAPWLGVYGLGALSAGVAAAMASAAAQARRGSRLALVPVAALTLAVAAGHWLPRDFTHSTGSLNVSLIQPNVAQDLKFDPERMAENFERLAQDIEAARGSLVVTPESVVPIPLVALAPAQWQRLQRAVAAPGRAALVGIFIGDDDSGYVNALLALSATSDGQGATAYRYGKQHLLPFGEFLPPGLGWLVRAMNIPLENQGRGYNSAPFVMGAQRLRPLICYEDLFGEDFVGSVVGDQAATILVNASNLAWFGNVMVQDQHLQFSRMRALEFQRPFVRATNTGATTVIDHHGRVTHRLAADLRGTLDAQVEGRIGSTPYARWLAAWGLAPLWALALLGIAVVALCRRADT